MRVSPRPPAPRILFGDNGYRVVLDGTRIILEYQDTDAAGGVRWSHIDAWNTQNTHAQHSHAEIAMTCILKNYDMVLERGEVFGGEVNEDW